MATQAQFDPQPYCIPGEITVHEAPGVCVLVVCVCVFLQTHTARDSCDYIVMYFLNAWIMRWGRCWIHRPSPSWERRRPLRSRES